MSPNLESFLHLPLELRESLYDRFFKEYAVYIKIGKAAQKLQYPEIFADYRGAVKADFNVALFGVCKQIKEEMYPRFLKNLNIHVEQPEVLENLEMEVAESVLPRKVYKHVYYLRSYFFTPSFEVFGIYQDRYSPIFTNVQQVKTCYSINLIIDPLFPVSQRVNAALVAAPLTMELASDLLKIKDALHMAKRNGLDLSIELDVKIERHVETAELVLVVGEKGTVEVKRVEDAVATEEAWVTAFERFLQLK